MSQTALGPRTDRRHDTDPEPTAVDTEQLLSLLSEPSVRGLLGMLGDRPMAARELAEATDVSRPTVYRRLNDLQEAGVVEVSMAYQSDGHHHKRYRLTVDDLSLSLAGEVEVVPGR
jgi:DNA-binding transcriptional ArsR family regulator